MSARLPARAVGKDEPLDHPADSPEARLSDLYADAVRESAGRFGCVWVVGRERDEKMTAKYASGIVPALPRAFQRDPENIPIDVDLDSISGPRPIVTSRHRRESRSRLQKPPSSTPPPLPYRSLLAELNAPPPKRRRQRQQKPGQVSFLSLMGVTAGCAFMVIVIALFVAQYRGMDVHAMLERTWHVIAQTVQGWLAKL